MLLALLAAPASAWAEPSTAGKSSRAALEEAAAAIPFDEMTDGVQQRLGPVVAKPSLYRQLPTQAIESDPDLFVFLIRHPEVIVNIWQLMGITNVQVNRTGPFTFEASDGAGSVGAVELVYGRPDLHVYFAEGYYEGPLFRNRINGSCVLVLRTEYSQTAGKTTASNRLDMFLRLDHVAADWVAKTLQPLMVKSCDHNFVETSKFVGQLTRAAEKNGPGVQRLAGELKDLDPRIRDLFVRFTDVAYQRSILRQEANAAIEGSELPTAPAALPAATGATPVSAASTPLPFEPSSLPPAAAEQGSVSLRR